jgi:DNA-binding transcriptional ArsR family regulator
MLTQFEVDVLRELCQTRETRSAVILAGELWARRNRDSSQGGWGDPYGMVHMAVESLSDEGLITYVQGENGVPIRIRVTRRGYAFAGFDSVTTEVGSWIGKRVAHTLHRDATEWRVLDDATVGGVIDRCHLRDHLRDFPEHSLIHPSLDDVGPYFEPVARVVATERDRSKIMTSPAARTRVIVDALERIEGPATLTELIEATGLSQPTVSRNIVAALNTGAVVRRGQKGTTNARYALTAWNGNGVATPEPEDLSGRNLIIQILAERTAAGYGEIADMRTLLGLLARRDSRFGSLGLHSLEHQLRSMAKLNIVTFDAHAGSRDTRSGGLFNIALQPQALDIYNRSDGAIDVGLRPLVPEPVNGPAPDVEQAPEPEPEPEPEPAPTPLESWPLLDELRARIVRDANDRERAQRLLQAAELLEGIDDDERDRLMERAAEVAQRTSLSAMEAEYLAYAQEHKS